MARSVFYYHDALLKALPGSDVLLERIFEIFNFHQGRYGYRRITAVLQREGYRINHKKVQRLMQSNKIKSTVRPKKFKSYRGNVGKLARNELSRNFKASRPNEKWVTDITEFKVGDQKVYLSPVIDLFNQEVTEYTLSTAPRLELVTRMLRNALSRLGEDCKPILHSDQGWHYQNPLTQRILKDADVKQSMSRKGNCLDNAVAENFFALLKTEMFNGKKFKDTADLMNKIDEYIDYYNNVRIKIKLNGLSPVEYRNKAMLAN